MQDYIDEAEVQNRIATELVVKNGILSALNIDTPVDFIKEDTYINGITADFTIVGNNHINAIVECKAGNINVTDYVRGIGQLFQYEYFREKEIPHKSFDYSDSFQTVYFYPSSVIRNNTFNIARFKYPETMVILELNETNNAVRLISDKELKELEESEADNLVTISQYYFRDNRIFEYYILLKYLLLLMQLGKTECHRKTAEETFLKKLNTINNGNWRNAFITLANLGLINGKNLPTEAGKQLALMNYEDFAVSVFFSYLEPYFREIHKCFNGNDTVDLNNHALCEVIDARYSGRNVLYLTQSNGRYVSSWMNIFRDDYGIINFEPKRSYRKLVYNPLELNKTAFANKIKQNSIAYEYIERYTTEIQKGII